MSPDQVFPNQKLRQAVDGFKKKYLDSGNDNRKNNKRLEVAADVAFPAIKIINQRRSGTVRGGALQRQSISLPCNLRVRAYDCQARSFLAVCMAGCWVHYAIKPRKTKITKTNLSHNIRTFYFPFFITVNYRIISYLGD